MVGVHVSLALRPPPIHLIILLIIPWLLHLLLLLVPAEIAVLLLLLLPVPLLLVVAVVDLIALAALLLPHISKLIIVKLWQELKKYQSIYLKM